MKLLFLLGDAAVGKMTVGQELMKTTGLRLFHNHVTIEPVIEVFGRYDGRAVARLRDVFFEEFAASDLPGMIFTYMFAFDQPSEWAYLEHVRGIFTARRPDTAFYYAELVAPQAVRLSRNDTPNRLLHKPSKRDLGASRRRLLDDDRRCRCQSLPGEVPFDNYIRVDNADLPPERTAALIRERFGL